MTTLHGIKAAEHLPLNAPVADVLLLGPDGEAEFAASFSLDSVQVMTFEGDAGLWAARQLETHLKAGVRMRCAGSLCAIGWPG